MTNRIHGVWAGLLGLLLLPPCGFGATLAVDGRTEYVIQLGADAVGPEKTAAERLAFYLKTVTGAEFPIVSDNATAKHRILVGPSKTVKALLPDLKGDSLGHDGIVIKTVGGAYRTYDLGVQKLNANCGFYFATGSHSESVKAVYLDRIILVPVKD